MRYSAVALAPATVRARQGRVGYGVGQDRHYKAFISYSHADRQVAQWLHGALERYRVPSRLVGEETDIGTVPARLAPIFRDRDELSAAGSLSEELRAALLASDFLIVIASPAAAASRWVNEEIRLFKQMHGEARVLALIASGNPGERGSAGAFPPALRFHVGAEGQITEDLAEPIAADIRPEKDGKRLAKLKIAAGLTGLPLDSLVQREAARRQRWLAGIATASLALVAIMAVLTVLAIQGQREAERQRAEADGLIEFMLTDLRAKLEPVGRLDALDAVGQRAMAYYGGQNPNRLDPDALGRRARALMLVGEVRDLRGDGAGALAAFEQAEASTAELLARDPDNPDRMFDHAQSVFYVGQMAWERRNMDTAEDRFRQYVALADQMLATDPSSPRWLAEVGYAANGLGAVLLNRRQVEDAVTQFERYVTVTAELAAARPGDPDAIWDHSQARAWLADAHYVAGALDTARAERMAEQAILADLLAVDPGNANAILSRARADQALAVIDLAEGKTAAAAERAGRAWRDMQQLLTRDPANSRWRGMAVDAANSHAEALLLAGRWQAAGQVNRWARTNAELLVAANPENRRQRTYALMPAQWMEIAILFGEDRDAEARAALARFVDRHGAARQQEGDDDLVSSWLAVDLMMAADRKASGDSDSARAQAAAALPTGTERRAPHQQAMIALLAAFAEGRPPLPSAAGYPAHAIVAAVTQ